MDPLFPLAALAIGGAVGMALAGFRDPKADERPKADEHDVSDYKEPAPVNPEPRSLRRYEALNSQPIPATMQVRYDFDTSPEPADDILPPAPPGMNAGSPLYAGMLFDTWLRERWGSTSPDAIADRMLRESAAEVTTR